MRLNDVHFADFRMGQRDDDHEDDAPYFIADSREFNYGQQSILSENDISQILRRDINLCHVLFLEIRAGIRGTTFNNSSLES